MTRLMTGTAHVRAHRYAARRLDWALTLGTALPDTDPGRAARRSTLGSYALAVVLLAAVGVLAIARPAPDWASSTVLVEKGSGAVFVNRDGVLHPALNLTSALLAATGATASGALAVSSADIRSAPRGSTLGIAGAPATLPSRDHLVSTGWSLCDAGGGTTGDIGTTAVIGRPAPGAPLGTDEAALVIDESEPAGGSHAVLLWTGRRIPVDLADRPLVQALGVDGVRPRPVSSALLAALPEVLPPDPRALPGLGEPGAVEVTDAVGQPVSVGSVLRVARADGTVSLQLVHRDGLEAVSAVLADLLLARWGGRLVPVPSWQSALMPESREPLRVATVLPVSAPRLVPSWVPVLCADWQGAIAGWTLTSAMSLDPTVPLVPSPPGTSRLDQIQIVPGTGAVVRAESSGTGYAALYLISDLGIAFPVAADVPSRLVLLDDDAAPPAAPAVVLDVLPHGPQLSAEDAGRPWPYHRDAGQLPSVTSS